MGGRWFHLGIAFDLCNYLAISVECFQFSVFVLILGSRHGSPPRHLIFWGFRNIAADQHLAFFSFFMAKLWILRPLRWFYQVLFPSFESWGIPVAIFIAHGQMFTYLHRKILEVGFWDLGQRFTCYLQMILYFRTFLCPL